MKKQYLLVLMGTFLSYQSATVSATNRDQKDATSIQTIALVQTATVAEESSLQGIISNALDDFEQTNRADWSYRITRYENEEGDITSSIEVHDAQLLEANRWTLLQLNGETPTQKQQAKFAKKKAKIAANKDKKSITVRLRDIIQFETLELLEQTPTELRIGFAVSLPEYGDDASKSLTGKLIYDKEAQFINEIEITNTDVFSPLFSADIEAFKMTLSFQKIENAILPVEHALEMRGTFAFFTEINEVSSDKFSDYRPVIR